LRRWPVKKSNAILRADEDWQLPARSAGHERNRRLVVMLIAAEIPGFVQRREGIIVTGAALRACRRRESSPRAGTVARCATAPRLGAEVKVFDNHLISCAGSRSPTLGMQLYTPARWIRLPSASKFAGPMS
jgi:hypothetical protein